MGDEVSTRQRRWQFSFLNLLLVTTIIALSVTVVMLNRSIGPLRQELVRLRNEVGELHIEDPTKLHAIRVNTDSDLEWKWRIWVPEGQKYRLRAYGGNVPKEGYPSEGGTMYLHKPGEHVIRYRITRDPRNTLWFGSLHTQEGSVGAFEQSWVEFRPRTSTGRGVGTFTQSFEPSDKPVEIMRHRVSEKSNNSTMIEDPAAGFLIWLEPE